MHSTKKRSSFQSFPFCIFYKFSHTLSHSLTLSIALSYILPSLFNALLSILLVVMHTHAHTDKHTQSEICDSVWGLEKEQSFSKTKLKKNEFKNKTMANNQIQSNTENCGNQKPNANRKCYQQNFAFHSKLW